MVEQALAVLALEREDLPQLLLEQVGPVEAAVDLGDPGQLGRLLLGEVFGFFHNAYRACLRSRACSPSPSLRAVFQVSRRTSSRASVAQWGRPGARCQPLGWSVSPVPPPEPVMRNST